MLFQNIIKDKKFLLRHDYFFLSRIEFFLNSHIEGMQNEIQNLKLNPNKNILKSYNNHLNLSQSNDDLINLKKLDTLQIELENLENYYNLCKYHIYIVKQKENYNFFEFFKIFKNYDEAEGAIFHLP